MVFSEVAITVSIEWLARRAHLSLATILIDRSLLSLALLSLIVRPARNRWMPRSPQLALLRVVTGGLTYVGWFGAIGLLSGRVTQAVLLLDALILAYVRGQRRALRTAHFAGAGPLPSSCLPPRRCASRERC